MATHQPGRNEVHSHRSPANPFLALLTPIDEDILILPSLGLPDKAPYRL